MHRFKIKHRIKSRKAVKIVSKKDVLSADQLNQSIVEFRSKFNNLKTEYNER